MAVDFPENTSFFRPISQFWGRLCTKGKPVVVDTITTRFLLLFLFLLSIPLISVIIFTVSLLVSHMDDANAFQLTLSRQLVTGALDNAQEKLSMLERLGESGSAGGKGFSNHLCDQLQMGGCLLLNPEQAQHPRHGKVDASVELAAISPDLASLDFKSMGLRPFYARLGNQVYLLRRTIPTAESSQPLLMGLPLDAAFFNRIFSQQPNLQSEVWLVADSSGGDGHILVKAHAAAGQGREAISESAILKGLRSDAAQSSQPVEIKQDQSSYLVMQDNLYTHSNLHIGRLLYILPLDRNQLLLSNYYVGIYMIAVASLIFSVLLAMAAGRTITQPLLKLINQVNKLSRESSMRDDEEVLITGVFEIRQLGEAFNRMMKRLRQEHKMRDDFVATLTHDLKVPLLAEKQTLSYMVRQTYGPVTEEQGEVLDSLQSSNRSCLSLVTGLLEVYRYDAGEVSLVFDSFDMVTLLTEVANEFQALAQEKIIRMEVESTIPAADEEAIVYADRLEIKRVLGNLISNAIVNTPKHGNIRCKITNAEYYGGDTIYKVSSFQHTSLKYPIKLKDRLMVTIQDSGLGFSNKDLAALFKQFAANKSRNPMSIGLGLYNCHQVLKAHQSVVWVESTEGEGSLVSFILPQNKKAAQDRRIFRDRRRYK